MAPSIVTFIGAVCMLSWSQFNTVRGVNYVGVQGSFTWDQAKAACENGIYVKVSGGQLATWNSYDQYRDQVLPAVKAVGNSAWIGLTDTNAEGIWHFIDDRSDDANRATMDEWSNGEPNDSGSEDCAHVWSISSKRGDAWGLNDANCGGITNYVCEFDFSLDELTLSGKQEVVTSPYTFPEGDNHYFYIFEMQSKKDMIYVLSLLLNVITVSIICCLVSKRACRAKSARPYSKVSMYSTDADEIEEKI